METALIISWFALIAMVAAALLAKIIDIFTD
jgi:hypothetical protein